jgi:hypothetical protein
VIHAEALTISITVRREVERRGEAEAESQVILKLVLAEFRPIHVTQVRRQPGAILLAPDDGSSAQGVGLGLHEVIDDLRGHISLHSGRSGSLHCLGGVLVSIEPGSLSEGVCKWGRERLRGRMTLVSNHARIRDAQARPLG